MTRYRIVTLPDPSSPGYKVYDVEQWRPIFLFIGFWDFVERFDVFENAKQYVEECRIIHNVVDLES